MNRSPYTSLDFNPHDGRLGRGQQAFSNRPTVVADNGHGTKVKLWNNDGRNGEFQNVTIERSFKREGSDQWETQKVSVNASDLLMVARGLEKAHDAIVEKQAARLPGQSR